VVGLVVGASGSQAAKDAILHDGPGCPLKTATGAMGLNGGAGIDCPFCGMTRATLALGGGDLHTALGFHPLAPLVLALNFGLMIPIVLGRSDMLLKGRRVFVVLAIIAAIWILRFVL
jgi:hypothetical protein